MNQYTTKELKNGRRMEKNFGINMFGIPSFVVVCLFCTNAVVTGVDSPHIPPRIHNMDILEPVPIQDAVGRDTLMMACSASGNPVPQITWSFNGVVFQDKESSGAGNENEGEPIRHTLENNRITIRPIRARQDTGKYRCIATNVIGSVFVEKRIRIRELGEFTPGNTMKDPTRKYYPTIGRPFHLTCPDHRTGYGTKSKWGIVHKSKRIDYMIPTVPIKRAFPNGLQFQYMHVTNDDIKRSRDTGGLQCILINLGQFVASVKNVLWNPYKTIYEKRKPRLVMFMKPQMTALVDTEFSIKCGAVNYPIPKISWQYQGQGIRSKWLNNSDELNFEFYRLLAGGYRLSIRRVTKYSGGTFRCFAENELGLVWKIGQLTVLFPPKWTVQFPPQIEVPIENSFQLNCTASGVPQPTYEWYHNGTLIKNSLYRSVEGGLLRLIKSRYKDDGIYICLAISDIDTLSQSTQIIVREKKPEFEAPLKDPIYLFKTLKQHIQCRVVGGPPPKITWFHNDEKVASSTDIDPNTEEADTDTSTDPNAGKPVVEREYKVLDDGTLEIASVGEKHAGVFKCLAENIHGKEEQTAKVDLVEPTVITHPPANLIYQVGWPFITMFCGASYDKRLDLRIEWYKGGVRLMKTDAHVYTEGRASGPPRLLYIENVGVLDRGNYSCHAYTKIGDVISEDWGHGYLRVKGPPEPPAGVTAQHCGTNEAKLVWGRGEELEAPTRTFYVEFKSPNSTEWFTGNKPGEILLAEPGTITYFNLVQRNQQGELINHLPPGANLIFRVKAASDHLIGRPSKHTKVGTCITSPAKPMINPYNVSSYATGKGTLFIQWKPVTDVYYGAPGFYYKVAYRTDDAPAFTVVQVSDPTVRVYQVPTPGKGVKYHFYVQSVNSLGEGPTPIIYSNYSGKDPPTSIPKYFRVKLILRYSVELRWGEMPEADGFQVQFWNVTDSEDQRGHTPEHFQRRRRDVGPGGYNYQVRLFLGKEHKNGASLTNLTADQMFLAQVAAVNSGGVGNYSYPIEFYTEERVPGAPTNVVFQTYGGSARIQWNPPADPNGYIEAYRIVWYTTDPHDRTAAGAQEVREALRPRREMYLLNVFKPLTYYTIKLHARNRIGPGKDWQRELMAVSVPDIPGKPDAPIATPFDDNSVNVTFQLSSYGGFPTKFRVLVRERTFYYKDAVWYEQSFPNRTWILVKGLRFVTYDFHTVAINEFGQSETSDVTEQRPVRRPKRQARAQTAEWWRSNYFILMMLIMAFLILLGVTVMIMLRSNQPHLYQRMSPEKKKKRKTEDTSNFMRSTIQAGRFLENMFKNKAPPLFKKKAPYELENFSTLKDDSIENLIDVPPPYEDYALPGTSSAADPSLITRPLVSRSQESDQESSLMKDEEKQSYTGSETTSRSSQSHSETESGSESGSETGEKYSDEKWSDDDEGSGIEVGAYNSAMPEVIRSAQSITYLDQASDVGRGKFI